MPREIIYVPQEKVPVFGFRTPEKPVEVKDFYITAVVMNNLQADGRWYLVLPWVLVVLIPLMLMAAAVDVAVFLVLRYFFLMVWKVLTDGATGVVGKAAKVLGIAAAAFLVFVFFHSGAWKTVEEYLVGWWNNR